MKEAGELRVRVAVDFEGLLDERGADSHGGSSTTRAADLDRIESLTGLPQDLVQDVVQRPPGDDRRSAGGGYGQGPQLSVYDSGISTRMTLLPWRR